MNEKNDEDVWYEQMEWADNPFLSKKEIAKMTQSLSADELESRRYGKFMQNGGMVYTEFDENVIAEADILYMTRVQRERFTDLMEYERVKDVYILRNEMLKNTRENLRILHPLPRVNEIAYDVDENPKAYYFQQAQNGLYARQAILCDVLGITLEDVIEDEVTEEVVQAVAEGIAMEAEENDKSVEEVVDEIIEEAKEDNKKGKKSTKQLDEAVKGRGFNSYDEAVEYSVSDSFKNLHELDQEEFTDWLRNLK